MVMSRLKIPNFEDLLKKVRQPKVPAVSAPVTPQDTTGAIPQGLTLPSGWEAQPDPVKGISFVSPRGNTWANIKLSPEGKIADLSGAMVNGKPIKIPPLPPLPPPEPIDEQVRKQLKDFEVKRGAISPVSAPVTPQLSPEAAEKVSEQFQRERFLASPIEQADIEKFAATLSKESIDKLPSLTWLNKAREVGEDPAKLVPFLSGTKELYQIGELLRTASDLEAGNEVSRGRLLDLQNYIIKSQQDTDFGYKVASVVAGLLPYAGELVLTGGIFTAGRIATVKAGQLALKKLATRTGLKFVEGKLAQLGVQAAGVAAGGTLQTLPASATRIPAATIQKQLQGTLTGDEEAVWRSLVKSVGESWVEVVSERTGGALTVLGAPIKGQMVKMGLLRAIQKANPGKNVNDLRNILGKMGYNGVLGEMFEERVADVGHGVLSSLGLGNQEFKLPSMEQLGVELVAFSIPAAGMQVLETAPAMGEKIAQVGLRGGFEPGLQPGFVALGGEQSGDQIAKALGIKFDGIQKGTANIPDKLQFTDPQTGSTTYGNTLEEVRTNIENMRAKFESAKTPQNVPVSVLNTPMPPAKEDTLEANTQRIQALQIEKNRIEREVIKGEEFLRTPTSEEMPRLQALYDRLSQETKRGDALSRVEVNATIRREVIKPAPLHVALIQEGEQLVAKADPANPDVIKFKGFLEQAKTTTGKEQIVALRGMEGLEDKVRGSSGMAPSTSVQTGLPGMGKEAAQVQMFGEVSGKESRKVPLIEVPKKGVEPLPGQTEAFREAEEQVIVADKATIEAQAKSEMLRTDPVASYRFKMGGRNVGLDSLISIKEQTFPEYLTVKQTRALNPEKSFAKYTVKGTKFYNKVPKDAALDQLTKEFNMTPDEIAARVMEIRAERRAIRQAPLTPASEPTQQEKVVATTFGEAKVFSEKQKEQLIRLIGEYLENPNTDTAWELTRELRRETRAGQALRLNERTQELLAEGVATEVAMTQAKREIMTGELPKVMTDFFDDVTDTMRVVLFDRVYQVLKDEPFERLSTQDALTNALVGRPIPNIRPTPPPGGFKSRLWPQGASALDKLRYVFGNQPKLLAGIQKMAEEKKPLRDVVEGIFREVDSWQAPMPIDQESADYLRALATKPMGQPRLGEEANIPRVTDIRTPEEQRISGLRLLIDLASTASPNQAGYINLLLLEKDIPDILKLDYAKATNSIKNPGGQARELLIFGPTGKLGLNLQAEQMGLSQEQFADIQAIPERRSLATMLLDYRRKNLMSDEELLKRVKDIDWETISTDESLKLQRELWIAKGSPGPIRPEFMDKNVWDTFKEKWMPGFNFDEKKMIVKVLQEIGLAPIDIGNFLRANMSSVDFSFFRTGRMLGSGHPVAFYKALLSGWKATWSQKEADAHWRAITLDPDYELYERIRKDTGYDPFRVPAKEREAAFRKSEEFGFPIEERFIPRMGQKLPHIKMSSRGFETALNDLVWSVWKQQLAMARRYGMKVASGQIKLKPGEAWDTTKEMTDHQRMLGDMVQRASLNINVGKIRADFTPASPAFGGALFAPRAKWARLIVGRHLLSANPRVRAEALKDMSIWAAETAGIVLLGAMLGLWEVETDPVSGQFMSIRIGKVRIDPWEGHRQIVNLYSRLITGQTKSTITEKKHPTNVMDTLANFVRSSLNVLPGLITDIKMGKTFTGEKTGITNLEQTARRVLPFSLSQIWETFQENWRLGLVTLPISVLGESISAYDTAESVSTEAIAKLGKVDIEAREEKVQKAKEAGYTPARIAEIMADDKAYDMEALRSDLNKSTSKGVRASPIVADYWTFKEQDDKYAKMSTKEQEAYLKDNPNYVTDRLFWGEITEEIPDLRTANKLVARAEKYGFNLDVIPAFQKADKTFEIEGEEVKRQVDRIPADRNLWPGYFDYKNLPEDTTQTARDKYLNDNPNLEAFLVVNTERTTLSSLEAAQKAANSGVPLNQIPAFSLTDKGKERIPSDRNLWKAFFDYNDLPGSSYLAMTQEQVDAGLLPEKYLLEWETYHKLKTDTAKDIFRKDHKEVSKGTWRDDFRRANPEFDKWLQENLDMKPLPVKKLAVRRGGISVPRAGAIGGGVSFGTARPRGGKPSYPKFKKVRVSGGMNVGAPRAPRI